MPAASTINHEEREFVVDSGASMHMVSKKDLDEAELETVRVSKKPTVVMTVNGEVQAKEEATVYVRGLDLLVTVMLLENTPAVLSLGKLSKNLGTVIIGRVARHHISSRKARKFIATHHVPLVVPGLSTSSSTSSASPKENCE